MKDLWVPLSGAIAQQRNVETIANNVANANTPGFKKDQLAFKEYLKVLEKGLEDINLPRKEWSPDDFYQSQGAEKAQVKIDGSYTNHQQGQLAPTGNHLDFALHGKGFFEVLTPNGIRYTRRGTFTLNNQGQLVTSQGFPVLSKLDLAAIENAGENAPAQVTDPTNRIITMPLDSARPSINLQGEIFAKGQKVSDLSLVEFNDIHALTKEGQSHFINKDFKNIKVDPPKTAVHQGFVEQSNVNAVQEMSALIKANRHFESIQKVIKAYDQISGKSVNEISRF
ncbi:MAG: flagellar basal-body rod protein FlgF [Bacteriovoracaceae bacterium]|nr:flagellar basal-body rod protein FlgF [Bacteriovoracaceae bacterium]